MFQSFVKVAMRNLLRNKLYTFFNIFGLSVAIACCIVAYLNYDYSYGYDAFHENAGQIYRVLSLRTINHQEQRLGIVPLPLGPQLQRELPFIKRTVRLEVGNGVIRYQDKVFNERLLYADGGFLDMFTFPLKTGTANLNDKSRIVLSEAYAVKYFGEEEPIGKTVTLTYDNGERRELTISGVVKKFAPNSSIQFDILASSELLTDTGINQPNNWAYVTQALFVQLTNPNSAQEIQDHLKQFVKLQNDASPNAAMSGFLVEPLNIVALNARNTRSNMLWATAPTSSIIGSIITGILVLMMACFNYTNISIALSSKRLKEIGIRKVMGGKRIQLIGQFMAENCLLCLFAFVIALGLSEFFVPAFSALFPFVKLTLSYTNNLGLIVFLFSLVVATGIGAGLYPAYFISAYNPVSILRGNQKTGKINFVMRTLLTFQFALSMIAVVASIVFAQNAEFNKNFDLGFEKNLIIAIPIHQENKFLVFKNAIQNNPDIASISGSQNHIFFSGSRRPVRSASTEREAQVLNVGAGYIETMALRMKEGRSFDERLGTDADEAVIVNEKLAQEMNWSAPVGQALVIENKTYRVVGMMEDFYGEGLWRPIRPVAFRMVKPQAYSWMQIRIQPNTAPPAFDYIKSTWAKLFPDIPFEGIYQDQMLAEAVQVSESINTMFTYIAVIAIAIAVMGLFALVSLNIVRRTKEIGVRKVLGASVVNIMGLMNKEFVTLVFLAMMIADVSGYVMIRSLLDSIYSYHVDVQLITLMIGNVLVLFVSILIIGSQVWKTATANPVHALRYE